MSVPVITVDGPGGVGKGTLCFSLARYLGWRLLDSGALYRVVAHAAARSCWPGVKVLPSRAFLRTRDARDRNRQGSSLKPAEDALLIDSTGISAPAVFDTVVNEARHRQLAFVAER